MYHGKFRGRVQPGSSKDQVSKSYFWSNSCFYHFFFFKQIFTPDLGVATTPTLVRFFF